MNFLNKFFNFRQMRAGFILLIFTILIPIIPASCSYSKKSNVVQNVVADFSVSTTNGVTMTPPVTGTYPKTVLFTDKSEGDGITSRIWDYGDGNTETYTASTNPTHQYTSKGTYTVKLTVTDSAGDTDTKTITDCFTLRDPHTWYVDGSLAASGDGKTWDRAFKTIQEAENVNLVDGKDEIWVKGNLTYTLASTIVVTTSASLYGGFAGTETDRSSRDSAAHVTTIDGNHPGTSKNGCRAFIILADNVTIDGFVIQNCFNDANLQNYETDGITNDNDGGSAIYNKISATAYTTVSNCSIIDNKSDEITAGILNKLGNMKISTCTFSGNYTSYRGGTINNWGRYKASINTNYMEIDSCTFTDNYGNNGACITLDEFTGGALITNCTFDSNTAGMDGTAIMCDPDTIIDRCIFKNNTGNGNGTINTYCDSNGTTSFHIIITNSLFAHNITGYGGAICCNGPGNLSGAHLGTLIVANCTIYGNTVTSSYGSAICNKKQQIDSTDANSIFKIINCIIYGNTANGSDNEISIMDSSAAMPSVTYSYIGGGYTGEGNIPTAPAFVDSSIYDCHLATGSAGIDTGFNSALDTDYGLLLFSKSYPVNIYDLDGNARINNSKIDMGAYEFK